MDTKGLHPLTLECSTPTTEPALRLLVQQLSEVYTFCLEVGKKHTQTLMLLSSVAQPEIPADQRVPVLKGMFDELPAFFKNQSEKDLFHHLLHSRGIPQLEHLRSLHLVLLTLNHMTFTQLITLSSFEIHPPPTGFPQPTEGAPSSSSVSRPYSFIHNLKEMFKAWDLQTLSSLNQKLRASPLHLERKVLLELAPNTPWDMLHYVADILKLPIDELQDLAQWLIEMDDRKTQMVARLMVDFREGASGDGGEVLGIMDLKSMLRLSGSRDVLGSGGEVPLGDQTQQPPLLSDIPTPAPPVQTIPDALLPIIQNLRLRISRQPPSKTVYQRIVRPFPSVLLESKDDQFPGPQCSLFIEASLIRNDTSAELPKLLEGTKVIRVDSSHFGTFKKLKIMQTTQQLGSSCRIKFTLKVFVGGHSELVHTCHCVSNSIEVFSHTLYLSGKSGQADSNASVTEIIPPEGKEGTRCIILGSNFQKEGNLQAWFGERPALNTRWHEAGALLCNAPAPSSNPALISVSNDPTSIVKSEVAFRYLDS